MLCAKRTVSVRTGSRTCPWAASPPHYPQPRHDASTTHATNPTTIIKQRGRVSTVCSTKGGEIFNIYSIDMQRQGKGEGRRTVRGVGVGWRKKG